MEEGRSMLILFMRDFIEIVMWLELVFRMIWERVWILGVV